MKCGLVVTVILSSLCLSLPRSATAQMLPPQRHDTIRPPGFAPSASPPNNGYRIVLPVLRASEASRFYDVDKLSPLRQVQLSGWRDRGSIYAELLADYGGPVRFSAGSVVAAGAATANEADASQKEAVQRFFAGGGNAVFAAAWPLLFWSPQGATGFKGFVFLHPKLGIDVPVMGTSTDNFSANLDLGSEAHLFYITDKRLFSFFAQLRTGWIAGTASFADEGLGRQQFWFGQYALGVVLADVVRVSAQGPIIGPEDVTNRFGPLLLSVSLFGGI